MPKTRLDTEIPLIGNETLEIRDNQLPSNKQVLECFYHYTRHATPKLTARKAARCVIRKCVMFWEYAQIPMIREWSAMEKINKLVHEYRNVCKNGALRKETCLNAQMREIDFKCMLNDLFDIAHQSQVNVMKNEAARILLNLHREKGRKGYLDQIIDTKNLASACEDGCEPAQAEELEKVEPRGILANYINYVLKDEDIDELLKPFEDNEESDSDFECNVRPSMCSLWKKLLKFLEKMFFCKKK